MALAKFKLSAALLALIGASGCSSLLDDFDYQKSTDEYTKEVKISAVANAKGDVDKLAVLQATLGCNFVDGSEPDPVNNAVMSFLVVDKENKPYQFSELSYKIDDGPVVPYDTVKGFDQSDYDNEVSFKFIDLKLAEALLDPAVSGMLLAGGATGAFVNAISTALGGGGQANSSGLLGMIDSTLNMLMGQSADASEDPMNFKQKLTDLEKTVEKSYRLAETVKTISVRYETKDGMVNTANFNVEGGNFAKVLKECGWGGMAGKYTARVNARKDQIAKAQQQKAAEEAAAAAAAASEAAAAEVMEQAVATDAAAEAAAAAY